MATRTEMKCFGAPTSLFTALIMHPIVINNANPFRSIRSFYLLLTHVQAKHAKTDIIHLY